MATRMLNTTTKTVMARVPYLNCAPFFHGWPAEEFWDWVDLPPRQLGMEADAGRIVAGPMSLVDFLRLQDRFERLGNMGIAVRGRSGSALLFARKSLRQLDEATIAVTEDTSTTALLLRLILEQRYKLSPASYQRGDSDDADAALLIGDEALKARASARRYPYEVDLSFEWWLWQHLPFVFAVWAVRKDLAATEKERLSRLLHHQLAKNQGQLEAIAQARAAAMGMSADDVKNYLGNFVYRFSQPEEDAIKQFQSLLHESDLH